MRRAALLAQRFLRSASCAALLAQGLELCENRASPCGMPYESRSAGKIRRFIMLIVSILIFIGGLIALFTSPTFLGPAILIVAFLIFLFSGFRTIRPIYKGIVERFGK